jgi:Kinesin motor domain
MENVRVIIRLRPYTLETESKFFTTSNSISIEGKKQYQFDHIYNGIEPEVIYNESTKDMIIGTVRDGINSCIIAYGQTSSGKTYSISRITQCCIQTIFETVKSITDRIFLLHVSYFEVYNETIYDLVDYLSNKNIEILDKTIKGLCETVVHSVEDVQNLIQLGDRHRTIESNSVNTSSSRSHGILRISIESVNKYGYDGTKSYLYLCDLAGSENASKTGENKNRIKEATFINKSLLALTMLVNNLTKNMHLNYRDSKLTRILEPCIGNNSRLLMMCCINPNLPDVSESINTLEFGTRAKGIKQKATREQFGSNDKSLLESYRKEIDALKKQLMEGNSNNNSRRLSVEMKSDFMRKIDEIKSNILNYDSLLDIPLPNILSEEEKIPDIDSWNMNCSDDEQDLETEPELESKVIDKYQKIIEEKEKTILELRKLNLEYAMEIKRLNSKQ